MPAARSRPPQNATDREVLLWAIDDLGDRIEALTHELGALRAGSSWRWEARIAGILFAALLFWLVALAAQRNGLDPSEAATAANRAMRPVPALVDPALGGETTGR